MFSVSIRARLECVYVCVCVCAGRARGRITNHRNIKAHMFPTAAQAGKLSEVGQYRSNSVIRLSAQSAQF